MSASLYLALQNETSQKIDFQNQLLDNTHQMSALSRDNMNITADMNFEYNNQYGALSDEMNALNSTLATQSEDAMAQLEEGFDDELIENANQVITDVENQMVLLQGEMEELDAIHQNKMQTHAAKVQASESALETEKVTIENGLKSSEANEKSYEEALTQRLENGAFDPDRS